MKKVKYLILGAGISGLTFANFINDNDFLIIEKDERPGGYCKTTEKNGYVWDYAGHFFHFKTEEMRKFYEEKMKDISMVSQKKDTKIYYGMNLIDYPFQMNIHQLDKEEFIECLYDLFNKEEKEHYNNFLDMLYGKFGKSIVDKFLKPYNEKLYACDLNKLDKNAMGRFFPYADIKQIINNMKESKNDSYNNSFMYPRHGVEEFIKRLAEPIKNKIKLKTEVIRVDECNKLVYTSDGEIYQYMHLINTIPFNQFLKIMDEPMDNLLLNNLSYNKVLVFNLGFEKGSKYKEHWIYIPDKKYNYYRIGFYNNILEEEKLSMYIEIGFSKNDKIDVENELKCTLKNLQDMEVIKENSLIDYEVIIMDPAYVHIEEETSKMIENRMSVLNNNNIHCIGRYGAWTYCSMEDAMIYAKDLARKLQENGKEEK